MTLIQTKKELTIKLKKTNIKLAKNYLKQNRMMTNNQKTDGNNTEDNANIPNDEWEFFKGRTSNLYFSWWHIWQYILVYFVCSWYKRFVIVDMLEHFVLFYGSLCMTWGTKFSFLWTRKTVLFCCLQVSFSKLWSFTKSTICTWYSSSFCYFCLSVLCMAKLNAMFTYRLEFYEYKRYLFVFKFSKCPYKMDFFQHSFNLYISTKSVFLFWE